MRQLEYTTEKTSVEQAYMLPFLEAKNHNLLREQDVRPSSKFAQRSLVQSRYYVKFGDRNAVKPHIVAICQRLLIPDEAISLIQEELGGFEVSHLGAANDGGQLTYKLYFSRVGTGNGSLKPNVGLVAIGWKPRSDSFVVKEYEVVYPSGPDEIRQLVRESIFSASDKAEDAAAKKHLLEECFAIFEKGGLGSRIFKVTERDSARISYDMWLPTANVVTVADVQQQIDAIAAAFDLPEDEYLPWYRDAAHDRLINLALGIDGQGEPFFTFYHGRKSKPPAYVHSSGRKDAGAASFVYTLGALGYDYGSETRRDSFAQQIGTAGKPVTTEQLLAYIESHPYEASSLIWTLTLDGTAVYALQPAGAFAHVAYAQLSNFLNRQMDGTIEWLSIPGIVAGKARLLNGHEVPVIVPELRGMQGWSIPALSAAVLGPVPSDEQELTLFEQKQAGVTNFLTRVSYELRNLGRTSQARAMNFAATRALQIGQVFAQAAQDNMELDSIEAVPSPICRPRSDCWDVKLTFFDPANRMSRARKVYRLTVDVSDVVPVTAGAVRSWSIY